MFSNRYLVKGHTQTEQNSMIPTIEKFSENKSICSMDEWYDIMIKANKEGPAYCVNRKKNEDFLNFEETSDRKFWKKIGISRLVYIKVTTTLIEYKYEDEDDVRHLRIEDESTINQKDLVNCYSEKFKIDADKKKDLKYFIENDLISTEHHEFYLNLINAS